MYAQESPSRVAKRSDMGIHVMKIIRFSDTQVSFFEARKRSDMGCAALPCVPIADVRNRVFKLRIVQK